MRGSQVSGTLFSVKSQNWSKKILKSTFHNLRFTNAKFPRLPKVLYITVDLRYKRVGNQYKVP